MGIRLGKCEAQPEHRLIEGRIVEGARFLDPQIELFTAA